MAGFLALGNDQYIGNLKLNAVDGVENGAFVTANFATGEASVPTGAADGDVFFVENEITTIIEDGIDDGDFKVKNGEYVRLHLPQAGEVLVTTKFATGLAKGDVVAVGAGGVVEAVGTRTPKHSFTVKEFTQATGQEAVKLIAL